MADPESVFDVILRRVKQNFKTVMLCIGMFILLVSPDRALKQITQSN
jgi:hypothetical protein